MNPRIPHHKVVVRASIISVSITVLCLLCSPHYTAVRIENCSKSTSVITAATMKMRWCRAPQLFFLNFLATTPRTIWRSAPQLSSETETSLPFLVDSLYSSTNQEVFKKNLGNKSSHYEKYGRFSLCKGSHHVQPPN